MTSIAESPPAAAPSTPTIDRDLARWWGVAVVAFAAGIVLRFWGLGSQPLTYDEAFTADAAVLPIGDMIEHLRVNDGHPPLDYLLRRPFAGAGSEWLLRLPSVVLSIAALIVLAKWLRPRGLIAPIAVMFMSLGPLFVLHGREARMYPILMLAGVVMASATDRWLSTGDRRAAAVVGTAATVAVLTHVSALVFAGAYFLLAGRRRDRAAWEYRGALVGAVAVWAVVWGWAFVQQTSSDTGGWLPKTSIDWIGFTLTGLVTYRNVSLVIVPLLLVVGLLALGSDARLLRLSLFGFVLPFVIFAIVGTQVPVLMPRMLALGAWFPVVALAQLAVRLGRAWSWRATVATAALIVLLMVSSSIDFVRASGGQEAIRTAIDELEPGDSVTMRPRNFGTLLVWELVTKQGWRADVEGRPLHLDSNADPEPFFRVVEPGVDPSGRRWVITLDAEAIRPAASLPRCAPDRTFGAMTVSCLLAAGS